MQTNRDDETFSALNASLCVYRQSVSFRRSGTFTPPKNSAASRSLKFLSTRRKFSAASLTSASDIRRLIFPTCPSLTSGTTRKIWAKKTPPSTTLKMSFSSSISTKAKMSSQKRRSPSLRAPSQNCKASSTDSLTQNATRTQTAYLPHRHQRGI